MKKILLLLVFLGSAVIANSQTTVIDSMMYKGVWHYYRVYVPLNHNCSLIIHLHGYGSNGATEQAFTNYMPVADTAGFIVAYPDGLKDSTGNQYWNIGWNIFPNTDDVGYLSVFIDTLSKRYSINSKNVFASGLSVGGFMCHRLACELSNKIAAIASVAGSMTTGQFDSCTPARAVPVMEIHGTSDNTILYTGSTNMSSAYINIDTLIRFYVNIDQCNPVPIHTLLPHNPKTTNGTTVDHYVYTGGLSGATVELYRINNGSHVDWPGNCSGCNNDFNASQEIWRFFKSYHSAGCVLPVTLTSFTGKTQEKSIALEWLTESEINNKYFEVQYSTNAIKFTAIGTVSGHGTIYLPQRYTFTDRHPAAGNNYYRLKQVDEDGRFVLSNIINVDFSFASPINLYPDPVQKMLRVEGLNPSANTTLSIIDGSGKIIQQLTTKGRSYTYNLQKLSAGNYYLRIDADQKITTFKFLKE